MQTKWRSVLLAAIGLFLGNSNATALLPDTCDSDTQLVMMIASYRDQYKATQTDAASAMKEMFEALAGDQPSVWTSGDAAKVDTLANFAYGHPIADPKDVAVDYMKACVRARR